MANQLGVEDLDRDLAQVKSVVDFWEISEKSKLTQVAAWDEVRQYVYATDTSNTTADTSPWNNKTTRPKLTWIHDKLLTRMTRRLVPNDTFFRFKGSPKEEEQDKKADAVQHFMVHKLKHPEVKFKEVLSACLDDFINYGNAFAGVEYVYKYQHSLAEEDENGQPKKVLIFKGAKPVRISPWRVGIDATANSYADSYLVYRSTMRRDAFYKLAQNKRNWNTETIASMKMAHGKLYPQTVVDYVEEKNRVVDNVNLTQHWDSGKVEILEFFGDLFDSETGTFVENMHVAVVDRTWVLVKEPNNTYLGIKPVVFAGYRKRPDNLWCMGPLENLIGLQYRIDHLENAKSDALDFCVYPIIKVMGDATSDNYSLTPGEQWHVPDNGDVQLIYPDPRILMFESDIISKEQEMEEYAGVPKETAGFRTPGEKTGFEVGQLLEHAAEFSDEKLEEFESQFLEPLLNLLFELNIRNLDDWDLKSIPKEDLEAWMGISEEDLKQDGRLYPVGSKHARQRAMKIQKLTELGNLGATLAPEHISRFQLVKRYSEEAGLEEDKIVSFGAGIEESVAIEMKKQQVQKQFMEENPNAQPLEETNPFFGGGNQAPAEG